jgi:mannose/cellobiose epimerase-like protein (N-acyl-D-glucosamine 2-epimerase family)
VRSRLFFLFYKFCALLLFLSLMAGCAFFGGETRTPAAPQPPAGSTTIDVIAWQVLMNIHQHGWNPRAVTNGAVTGGLFTNWKMDNPSVTNAMGLGPSDATQSRHDVQVDLLYLTALADYRQLHPQDHTFDSDVHRMTATVIHDFASYNLPVGWIYFYLLRCGQVFKNATLVNIAHMVAQHFYTNWYDAGPGLVYDKKHHPADYDPNTTLEAGAALIDAGTHWHDPAWVNAGKRTINHVLAFALDPHYHLLYNNMMLNGGNQDQVMNYEAKPSTQAEASWALVFAYNLTHNEHYLDMAGQLLHTLWTSGLWDEQRGGFFFAIDMKKHEMLEKYKETRSQSAVLLALHYYDQVRHQEFATQEQQLVHVMTAHFYQPTYHGFFYRVTPDFQVYVTKPGDGIGVEDFFTTEAMGGALIALQRTELRN